MTSATLNIRVLARRLLTGKEAADYCGLSQKRFPAECGVSPISMPSGTKLYDMRDLDAWIDGLKDHNPTDDDEILKRLNR